MKVIYLIVMFSLLVVKSEAQSDTTRTAAPTTVELKAQHLYFLKAKITPDLAKQITTIPVNSEVDVIKKFADDLKNKSIQLDNDVVYKFKLTLKNDQDKLKVTAFSQNSSVKYDVIIAYTCTDPRHTIKHTANTLADMKKLQKQFGCSGITMFITDTPGSH